MAEEEMALGLQGTKRIENIQMGLARGHVFMSREITYSLRIHDQTVAYLSPSQKNIQPCSSFEFQGHAFCHELCSRLLRSEKEEPGNETGVLQVSAPQT